MFQKVSFLCLIAVVGVTVVSAQTSGPVPVDVKMQSKALVTMIRSLVTGAKEGTTLDLLHQNIQDLQNFALDLLTQLPGQVSECNTQAIIKMAAAGTGSHEVLQVLLASDSLGILSARLDLCLAMMSQIAQQFEGELTLSSDVSPYVAATLFATNTTMSVITTADKAVKEMALLSRTSQLGANRVKRQFNANLGGGWSVGLSGVNWQSRSGNAQFNLKPTFSGFNPTASALDSPFVSRLPAPRFTQ
ncbi:uncharacterized protein LOC112557705 [Pomacea canaliculata]|uniref:uncharacterized protein LOC112557705 n=1 Tax=Pomacea canaliculata TaxID=400727 RepID=UPI000D73848D|nr:uncharacterized protein LOC112557705 [Pomacea canaliculata]